MSLTPERTYERLLHDGLSVPVYEVSVCRHCGEAYILGTASTTKNYTWLDPRKPDINSDDYAVRSYYRLLSNKEDVDKDEEVMWLCTKCGTLHSSREGGPHRHPHGMCDRILIARGRANENVAKCGHCGYQNRYAIQPMRVSPEAAGSIVCYDLVRDVPPFEQKMTEDNLDDLFGIDQCGTVKGGNIICFSDRRQDAAYFAPAMLRTYNNVTKRQIIREAVTSLCLDGGSCRPSDIAKWIAHKRKTQYRFDGAADTDIDRRNEANGWILDELMAEDSRNSLEGLGLVEVSPGPLLQLYNEKPTAFEQLAKKAANSRPGLSWLMPSDYFTTMRVGLETLREQGAIKRPDGCQSHMTVRFRQTPFVIGDTDDSPRGTIHYVGSPRGNGNKRSSFIISLARRKHGVSISRDDAETLLGILYEDTVKVLRTLGRRDGTEYIFNDSATGGYLLSANLWTLRPQDESANLYLCNICGCMSQYDTGGVCLTRNCDGWPQRVDATEVKGKDQYYKVTYREEPLPIRVEEHTAQLSTKQAAKIQQDFIDGKVNVLSCTTTFELGVDVGDLRATFMRNVPPSPANYAQRAGRVGRRAGKPGFAVTFARLRPHDIEYFRMPAKIIAGETKAPSCYLSNPSIAIRHVFAVVLSEYFRSGNGRETSAGDYNDFMAIKEVRPTAIKAVRDFISSHRSNLDNQLSEILPKVVSESTEIGLSEGTWIERLLGDGGRLMRAHALVHEDWDRLERSAQMAKDEGKYDKASRNIKMQGNLYKKKTIEVLAESGVLPKYGFPTDLVQLFLVEQENALPDERLELSRGLRQAIREYAPGSEIVAGKRVWHSCGIAKPRERSYETRRFGVCSNKDCRAFVVPIDTGEDEMDCPLCSSKIKLTNRILVPSSGFRGKEVPGRNATLRRPRNHGFIDIKFVQNWTDGNELSWVEMPGGKLGIRYAGNGMLYAINRGPSSRGFKVCSYCGAAAPAEEQITHEKWCISKETQHYTGLGTDFTTDVLELTFALDDRHPRDPSEWRSLMWALVQAAVSLMNIPEGEIGATAYTNFNTGDESVLLYDNVPGGAGRVLQLNRDIDGLLQKAYEIVSTCDCGEDSCCYGCLCNYHNQGEQDQLSRGAAMRILGALMNQLAE